MLDFDATQGQLHGVFAKSCAAKAVGQLNVFLAFALMPDQDEMEADPTRARAWSLGIGETDLNPWIARACIEATFSGAMMVLECLCPPVGGAGPRPGRGAGIRGG